VSDFSFEIEANPNRANAAVDGVENRLKRTEEQARKTGAAIDGAFQDSRGRWRDAQGRFLLMGRTGAASGKQIGDAMDAASRKARGATDAVNGLTAALARAAALVGGVMAARSLVQWADGYTQISNRLNTVATDQRNLNGLIAASHGIAQDTFTDWVVTAEAVVRFTNATKELGVSQRQVLDFTTTLNKAIVLSGASTAEATNGLIQLSQGLASGALRGDELRSVLENLPTVADVIAKGMGKTRGELRKLGAEGKITAKEVFEAFVKAGPEIEQKFGKVMPTIAQQMIMVKNEAIRFFGEASRSSGVLRVLNDAFKGLIANFDTVAKVILGVGEALLVLFVIEKIIVLVRMLTLAIAANPLGAILVALTVGISLLRQFGDEWGTTNRAISETGPVVVTVGDYLRALWDQIKALGAGIMEFLEGAWHALTGAFSDGLDGSGIEFTLRNVLLFIASFVDAAIALFKALNKTIVAIFGGIPATIGEAFIQIARGVVRVFQEMVNALIRGYNFLDEKVNGRKNEVARTNARIAADREEREALLARAGSINPASFGLGESQLVSGNKAAGESLAKLGVDVSKYPKAFGYYGPDQAPAELTGADLVRYRVNAAGFGSPLHGTPEAIDRQRKALGLGPRDYGPGGGIEELDLSFKNPLEGSSQHMIDMLKDAWGKDFGSEVARDFVNGWVDDLDQAARDKAIERMKNKAAEGTISDKAGVKGKPVVTKEQENARKRLAKELESITAASNPMIDAQMKLAKAVDVTDRALKAGLLKTMEEADRIVDDTAKKTADAREPLLAWIRAAEKETEALRMTNGERERANAIRAAENDLRQKGLDIDARVSGEIAKRIDAQRGQEAFNQVQQRHQEQLQEALNRIRAPLDEYNRGLEIHRELLRDGAITSKEFEAAVRAIEDAMIAAGKARPSMSRTLEDGFKEMLKNATDTAGAMRSAFVNAYSGIENALVDLVTKGKADWSAMVQSMLADLTRLMLRQAIAAGVGKIAGIPAFATGGSFMVGGRGGTDSQLVAFRASPRERVTVENTSQVAQGDGRAQRGRGWDAAGVRIVNVMDPNQPLAAMDSPGGERLIVNTMIKNSDMLRSHITRK
jgi:lambda family phage tail tape measure protein